MHLTVLERRFGIDLISYQNNGKGRTATIVCKPKNVSEYSSSCIDMCADEALISA
jgi:hypothetical protein